MKSLRISIAELDAMPLDELEYLKTKLDDVIQRKKFKELPRVVVDGPDVRPRYLNGCTGKMGGWVSNQRRQFFPDAGTEAAARGPEWRVDASILRPIA